LALQIARDSETLRASDRHDNDESSPTRVADTGDVGRGSVGGGRRVDLEWYARCAPPIVGALIEVCAHMGDVDKALELLAHTTQQPDAEASAPAITGAITAPSERAMHALVYALSERGRLQEAVRVLGRCGRHAVHGLDNRARVSLMRACVHPASGEAALDLARTLHTTRLPSEGVAPTITLVRALGAHGLLDEAVQMYESASAGVLPHSRLGRHGVSEALQLLNAVLFACARCGDASAALRVYGGAISKHPGLPDAVSLNSLVAACESSGIRDALEAGFDALVHAHSFGAADARGVATLLSGCERHGAGRLAYRVHQWADESGMLRSVSPAARGVLLDGLFHTLAPADGASEVPEDAMLPEARGVLGCGEAVSYASAAYRDAYSLGLSFDTTAAQRCLVVMLTAAADFDGARQLLDEAERANTLIAPSQTAQALIVRQLGSQPDLDHSVPLPAIELFGAFERQRGDERWLRERGRDAARPHGLTLSKILGLGTSALHGRRRGAQSSGSNWENQALVERLAAPPHHRLKPYIPEVAGKREKAARRGEARVAARRMEAQLLQRRSEDRPQFAAAGG
jgi:hypothetical protein